MVGTWQNNKPKTSPILEIGKLLNQMEVFPVEIWAKSLRQLSISLDNLTTVEQVNLEEH